MSEGPAASDKTLPLAQALRLRLARTEAGRQEIHHRALPLSRQARNLLLIIDASRSAEGWLSSVQGAGLADLQALLLAGLVAEPGGGPAPAPRMSLAQALETKGYDVLYERLNAEVRTRLGLFKGYRLTLEIERCKSADELRLLARRFVEMVRQRDGDAAALAVAQVLLAPG